MLERVRAYRDLALDYTGTGSILQVFTEVPAGLALRHQETIPDATVRQPRYIRLPAMTGQHFKLKITGPAVLYGARVCLRPLGAAGEWVWAELPIRKTADGWASGKLPIRTTPEGWGGGKLPIRKTVEGWTGAKLPIRTTREDWAIGKLPIRKTAEGWDTMKLPLLASDAEWRWVQLPVDAIE